MVRRGTLSRFRPTNESWSESCGRRGGRRDGRCSGLVERGKTLGKGGFSRVGRWRKREVGRPKVSQKDGGEVEMLDGREQQEGRRRDGGGVDCSGEERSGEKERERYMEPRGVALQPARFAYLRSLFCMPSPPPSWLALLLLRSVPWNVLLLLPFGSYGRWSACLASLRCTVAFGLCIIITVTASSSWLVVEEPPCLSVASLLLPGRRCPLAPRSTREGRHIRQRETGVSSTRVYALIKFPRGSHAIPVRLVVLLVLPFPRRIASISRILHRDGTRNDPGYRVYSASFEDRVGPRGRVTRTRDVPLLDSIRRARVISKGEGFAVEPRARGARQVVSSSRVPTSASYHSPRRSK